VQFLQQQRIDPKIYLAAYYRGMSGHICTLITKNFRVNFDDIKARELIYMYILDALDKDTTLNQAYEKLLPNITMKDQISRLFIKHMAPRDKSLFERTRLFENAYHE